LCEWRGEIFVIYTETRNTLQSPPHLFAGGKVPPGSFQSNKPFPIECNIAQLNKIDYGNNHHLSVQHRDVQRQLAHISRVSHTRGVLRSSTALQTAPQQAVHTHHIRGQCAVRGKVQSCAVMRRFGLCLNRIRLLIVSAILHIT